jgi:hypothetical protein
VTSFLILSIWLCIDDLYSFSSASARPPIKTHWVPQNLSLKGRQRDPVFHFQMVIGTHTWVSLGCLEGGGRAATDTWGAGGRGGGGHRPELLLPTALDVWTIPTTASLCYLD